MADYSKMTQEDFDRLLLDILSEIKASQMIHVPGFHEVASEEFNNEVLDRWSNEQEEAS